MTLIFLTMSLPVNSVAQVEAETAAAVPRDALPSAPAGTWNAPPEAATEEVASATATATGMGTGTAGRGVDLLQRFAGDQKAIWTSPLRLERGDAIWALPALAGVGAFVASDAWLSRQVPSGGIARSRSLSDYGAFSLAGGAGAMFLFGKITHNDHLAETGFLASEAAVNAAAVDYALKSMCQRQRPYDGTGAGHFFAGGSFSLRACGRLLGGRGGSGTRVSRQPY